MNKMSTVHLVLIVLSVLLLFFHCCFHPCEAKQNAPSSSTWTRPASASYGWTSPSRPSVQNRPPVGRSPSFGWRSKRSPSNYGWRSSSSYAGDQFSPFSLGGGWKPTSYSRNVGGSSYPRNIWEPTNLHSGNVRAPPSSSNEGTPISSSVYGWQSHNRQVLPPTDGGWRPAPYPSNTRRPMSHPSTGWRPSSSDRSYGWQRTTPPPSASRRANSVRINDPSYGWINPGKRMRRHLPMVASAPTLRNVDMEEMSFQEKIDELNPPSCDEYTGWMPEVRRQVLPETGEPKN